jgi:Mrp family chromosome partitioning ATPase
MALIKAMRRPEQSDAPDTDGAGERPLATQGLRTPGRHTACMLNLLQSLEAALGGTAGGKLILFSSARPGEGKTMVAGELATTLTDGLRKRVAVIDAGLRHDLATRCGASAAMTLERLIASLKKIKLAEAMPRSPDALVVATVTQDPTDSQSILDEPQTWTLLKSAFDYVLVEMPSLADSPLALAHARLFDGVVLVIESGRTRWPIVQNAQEQLDRAAARVLGAFLNKRVFHIPKSLYNWL